MKGIKSWINKLSNYRLGTRWSRIKLVCKTPIERRSLRSLLQGPCRVTLLHPTKLDGNLSLRSQRYIAMLVKSFQAKRIFEIGTLNGNTTLQMAVNSPADAEIFTLNYDPEKLGGLATKFPLPLDDKKYIASQQMVYENTPYARKIHQLYGDSATFDFRSYYGQMDFVFIDGAHSYEYVRNDTQQALSMLGSTGIMVWDDYDLGTGVPQYLHELVPEKKLYWIKGTGLCVCIKPQANVSLDRDS